MVESNKDDITKEETKLVKEIPATKLPEVDGVEEENKDE